MEMPIGTIILWAETTYPAGWKLCDGTSGSPDLRNKFPFGAASDGDLYVTDGVSSHGHTNPTKVTVGGTHSHSDVAFNAGGGSSTNALAGGPPYDVCASPGHSHSGNVGVDSDVTGHSDHTLVAPTNTDHMPPYIKLYYIYRYA